MKLLIELPDKKVIALRKCAESGMELDSVSMAVVNGVPYDARKTGKWVLTHPVQEDDEGAYVCSCCHSGSWEVLPTTWKTCPWCDAIMEGEQE